MKKKPMIMVTTTLIALLVLPSMVHAEVVHFWWDNVYFKEGTDVDYAHPDDAYYGISPSSDWSMYGNDLLHWQVNRDTTLALVAGTVFLVEVLVLVLCRHLPQTPTAYYVAGIAGIVLAGFVDWILDYYFVDERGCMWLWIGSLFIDYLNAYLPYLGGLGHEAAEGAILAAFLAFGYFRIGKVMFNDPQGIGNPSPQTTTLSISIPTGGGTTSPAPGTHTYDYGAPPSVTVTAYPNSHYSFNYWLLDWEDPYEGICVYDNPITVMTNSDHDLKACFSFYNRAPSRPSLTGPTSGYVGVSYTFTARATDPDGDKIQYKFYWRDGTTTTTGFYKSGDYVSRSKSWGVAKDYYVYVKAIDYYGADTSSYTLKVTISPVNRAPNTPSKPSGSTSGYVGTYYYYLTSTTDPDGDDVKYKFDWGDYTYTTTGYYSSGATVRAGHKWSTTGYKSVRVKAYDGQVWSGWSSSLQVYIREGGGTGCPILYVYDGSEYVEEGLLDIHNPEGIDVVYEHTLASTPQRVHGTYLIRLTEHPKTHSYIDQAKLYAVLEDETVIELPLIWAWHSEDGNVLPMLLHSDEWKADTLGADHNDGTSQSVDLKFAALSPDLEATGFVFQIEGNNIIIK